MSELVLLRLNVLLGVGKTILDAAEQVVGGARYTAEPLYLMLGLVGILLGDGKAQAELANLLIILINICVPFLAALANGMLVRQMFALGEAKLASKGLGR